MKFRPEFKMSGYGSWEEAMHDLAPHSTSLDKRGRWVEKELKHGRDEKGRYMRPHHLAEALVRASGRLFAPRTRRSR